MSLVAFSGGCLSGKTTTMKALKEELEKRGKRVVMLDEFIRTIVTQPIDDLRKDAKAYFEVQKTIIKHKISQELAATSDVEANRTTIYLEDRALTDSMFYFENYVDTNNLSSEDLKYYYDFHNFLHKQIQDAFKVRYDYVIEFMPLADERNTDAFRPKAIDKAKYFEHLCIMRLNRYYLSIYGSPSQLLLVDYNMCDSTDAIPWLADKICEK